MRLYHFTSVIHLPLIEQSGMLRRTESNLHPVIDGAGPDTVWFTTRSNPVDGHGLDGGIADKSRVRFTCDVPDGWVKQWVMWAEALGIDPDWRETLIRTGGGWDAARTWMVTFRPVRRDRWVAIEHRPAHGWGPAHDLPVEAATGLPFGWQGWTDEEQRLYATQRAADGPPGFVPPTASEPVA